MGLKDEYQALLSKEEQERNALDREKAFQSQMPSEFQFSVAPLTLSSDISSLISEFIDLVPSGCWHSFPTNGSSPALPDSVVRTGLGGSLYSLYSSYNYVWFLQVMWPDGTRRMVPISIRHRQLYYRQNYNQSDVCFKCYGKPEMLGGFKKKERMYSPKEAKEDVIKQENDFFKNEMNNVRASVKKIESRMIQGMSQEFVCLSQSDFFSIDWDGPSRKIEPSIRYIFFRDGFVYECVCPSEVGDEFRLLPSYDAKRYSAISGNRGAKYFLLQALKRMKETSAEDCATGRGYMHRWGNPY